MLPKGQAQGKEHLEQPMPRYDWAVCPHPQDGVPRPEWFHRKEDAEKWQEEIVVLATIWREESETAVHPQSARSEPAGSAGTRVVPILFGTRVDSSGTEWTVIERQDGKQFSTGIGAFRKGISLSPLEFPLGFRDRVTRRDQGWPFLLPITWISDQARQPYVGRRFRDFMPLDQVGPLQPLDMATDLSEMFEDRHPSLSCDLGDDWQFDRVRSDAQMLEGHAYRGREIESLPGQLIKIAYDVETSLNRRHPNLSAQAISMFWTSWPVWQYLPVCCARIVREVGKTKPSARSIIGTDEYAAVTFVWRQLWFYAQEVNARRVASTMLATPIIAASKEEVKLSRNRIDADRVSDQLLQVAETVLGSSEKLLADALGPNPQSKALRLSPQIQQMNSSPQPGDAFTAKALPRADTAPTPTAPALFQSAEESVLSGNNDRAYRLTIEIFPDCSFIPEKLAWDVEEIVNEHEGSIREAVLDALSKWLPATPDPNAAASIFSAVVDMGTELFSAALDRIAWLDDYNPPDAYDLAADGFYQNALEFVTQKYESVASEIPGLSPACDAARLDALRLEWQQIREETKQHVHELSRQVREAEAEAGRLRDGSAAAPGRNDAPAKKPGDKPSGVPEPGDAPRSSRSKLKETPPGSMDRVSMTDPIWDFSGTKIGLISIKRLSGEVDIIDPSIENEPDDADLNSEEELCISEGTISGRSELRTEIETAFSGSDWPALNALIQAFRRHAVKVFDVNAAAYHRVIAEQGRDAQMALSAMCRNLLVGLFGREWENSPGEHVVRIRWQDGVDGWKGEEISVIAGNDADPTCLYHKLVGDAIKYRYRFHAPLPPHVPGEPPGLGVSNLEWWQYIGLKDRHDLAMAIKPHLDDRVEHWLVIYTQTTPVKSAGNSSTGRIEVPDQPPRTVRPSPTDDVSMDSPVRIKFEAGLALAEVTLDEDLKVHGPSLEIAQKYVTAATLTLARCILTPNCADPYKAIQRTYNFAEWFAGEAIKPAWVWLCVFAEMNGSGKLEKYKRDRVTEGGKAERMSDSEIRAWHACLFEVAHEALDEFVAGFWKDRLMHFSEHSHEVARAESVNAATARRDEDADDVQDISRDAQLRDVEIGRDASRSAASSDKRNMAILRGTDGKMKASVTLDVARRFGGVTKRAIERAAEKGSLRSEGTRMNRRITVESLLKYFPSEDNAT